jgi:hypothetical protein
MTEPTPTPEPVDPLSAFTDRLVADPFALSPAWSEFAAAARTSGAPELAELAETFVRADDVSRGKLLARSLRWWPVARRITARMMCYVATTIGETTREFVNEARAEHQAKMGDGHAVIAAAGQAAARVVAGQSVKVGVS